MHPTKKANKAQKKSPITQQKRGILSYRPTPNDPARQRRKAKMAMKSGEKPPQVFQPSTQQHPGAITQVLPNGETVAIFKNIENTTKNFGPSVRPKRAQSHLKPDTASEYIHRIASQVAQTKPVVVAESSLKDIKNEFISNLNGFTKEDYLKNASTNHIIRITPPPFTSSPMFRRDPRAKSANQQKRWNELTAQRQAEIKQKKADFKAHIDQLAAYTPLEGVSTSDSPLDFSNNLGLKFRVIDAVINHTKIQVPSSALAGITNVNELVDYVVAKRAELEANASARKNQERLPANVTYVYTSKIDRSKKPAWEKYQAARQKASTATADV